MKTACLAMIGTLLLACAVISRAAESKQDPRSEKLEDRLQRVYSYNDPKAPKTGYQNKIYKTGESISGGKVSTREYAGGKDFASKEFITKPYMGEKKSWFGNILFPSRKLPENLQGANVESPKKFASKDFSTKNFSELEKKSPYGSKEAYGTREISLKGKTQGAIDNDQHLQEAVKKGLSVDDVRKLLNKAP